ncbi:unnamed protein product [Leuciscus chuanchicus]
MAPVPARTALRRRCARTGPRDTPLPQMPTEVISKAGMHLVKKRELMRLIGVFQRGFNDSKGQISRLAERVARPHRPNSHRLGSCDWLNVNKAIIRRDSGRPS